jgi:hypothetical protein
MKQSTSILPSVLTVAVAFSSCAQICAAQPEMAPPPAAAPKEPPKESKKDAPKPDDKRPESDPQPPADMPTPPLEEVGDPGVPAPSAEPAPSQAPATQATPPTDRPPVLSGPAVGDAAIPRLTRRDFAGRIRRLDIFPGEAALDFLKLDHRTKVRVNAIVAERTALLDRIVRENIELVVKINDARQRGDNNSLPTLGRQFRDAASELTSRGSTAEEVLSILPPELREEYRRMLDSYWTELRDQMVTEAKQKGETTTFRQIIDREVDRIWTGEIRRSYERQVGQRIVNYDEALANLALEEATLGKCKDEVQLIVAKRSTLGPDERRDVFSRVYKLLDLERQAKFTAYVLALPPIRERTIEELAASLPPPAKDSGKSAKPDGKPEPKPAPKPDAKPDAKPDGKPDAMSETNPEPAPAGSAPKATPDKPNPASPEPQRPKTSLQ